MTPFALAHTKETHPSAEHEALDRAAANHIWEITLTLPAKFKEVLLLHVHHHLTIAEISSMLGIEEGTVKSRLHRARSKLQKRLEMEETAHG